MARPVHNERPASIQKKPIARAQGASGSEILFDRNLMAVRRSYDYMHTTRARPG
jgi:hypothetical protein